MAQDKGNWDICESRNGKEPRVEGRDTSVSLEWTAGTVTYETIPVLGGNLGNSGIPG